MDRVGALRDEQRFADGGQAPDGVRGNGGFFDGAINARVVEPLFETLLGVFAEGFDVGERGLRFGGGEFFVVLHQGLGELAGVGAGEEGVDGGDVGMRGVGYWVLGLVGVRVHEINLGED